MLNFCPERIYVERSVKDESITANILCKFSSVPIEYVENPKILIKKAALAKDAISKGKRRIFVTKYKGKVLKKCPGTKYHICCNYYVLNIATNCYLDCTYCVLQSYLLNNPLLVVFANIEKFLKGLEEVFSRKNGKFYRIGTGELTDSLALDGITNFSKILVPFFAKWNNTILELKTKTDSISNLYRLDHKERTVVSFSLNPQRIIQNEEPNTSTLKDRIEAARICQELGYRLGFHFDPLIYYHGWEEGYYETVKALSERIDPGRIVWISLGALRFMPNLKPIIKERFPHCKLIYEELFPGLDSKLRYFKPIRVEMYRKLLKFIRSYNPGIFVYLCMETREVWERVFGWSPMSNTHLGHLLDERVR
ncbi:MAG: hypothetical protein QME40_06350 [bacterium]|nr:hypothetical protein [bacterium]